MKLESIKAVLVKPSKLIFSDPYLANFYPVYSLAANLTNPNHEVLPELISFKVKLSYIPEGEEDLVAMEILLHKLKSIRMFLWKNFEKDFINLFLRYKKITWKLRIMHSDLLHFDYHLSTNNLICHEGVLDKIVGWPKQRQQALNIFNKESLALSACSKYKIKKSHEKVLNWVSRSTIQYLLDIDIDIALRSPHNESLLHFAARIPNTMFIKCIIDKFKTVNVFDKNKLTPLHEACKYGQYENAKILLEHQADVDLMDNLGRTSLMLTVDKRHHDEKLVRLLLKYNANCNLESQDGMRAIDYARQIDPKSIIIPLINTFLS